MANLPEKTDIKKAIDVYCQIKALSKNSLADQIGISGATLSNISNNKWNSIDEKMWQKIWNYVRPVQLYDTNDFASITTACIQAKEKHFMTGITADTGMGKTTALRAYGRNENVFYIYYDTNMRPKHFFQELGKLLGYDYEANMYELVNRVCSTLNTLKNPLIIIDEASKLTDPMIMALHVLRDKTIHNCGLVLAGMPYFRSNLIKKANKQKIGISEFLRRIMMWHELNGLSSDEIEVICKYHGIETKKEIAKFKSYRRFGDLMNAILFYNTIND